jgi:hypothetical protein
MDKTIVVQNNTQVLVAPETYEYKMETTITYKGELPRIQIFVYKIVDAADPSSDTFARVANVGDLDGEAELLISRDATIAAGATEYTSSYCSIQYPDLTIATQAKSAIATRINELISDWVLYHDTFIVNNGIDQLFPSADPALEETLTAAYADAKSARKAAEIELVAADTELTLAEKDVANAKTVYGIYKEEVDFCQKTRSTDWLLLDNALTALLADVSFVDPAKANYLANGQPARVAVSADLLSFSQNAAAKVAASYNNVTTTESLAADAVTNKKEAEASLAAAQKAEAAALAALMAVCPTFDPSSV